jgi:TRAP-type C4-dicarboxylate transport system substrate-binding protein
MKAYVKKLAAVVGSAAIAVSVAGCGESTADSGNAASGDTARLSSYLNADSSMGRAIDNWADEVEECAAGELTFDRFHDGSLFGAMDTRNAVGAGRAEVGAFSAGYHTGDFPLTDGLFLVPFISSNVLAIRDAMAEMYETHEETKAEWNDQGMELMTMVPVTPTSMNTNVPFEKLEDLEGLSIRGYPGGGLNAGLEAAGANPVDMDLSELPEGMQRGVIDGYGGVAMDVSVAMSMQESTDYFTEPGFGSTGAVSLAVNKDWLDGLSPEVQNCLTQASDGFGDQYMEVIAEVEADACEVLEEAGVNIDVLPESEVQRWSDMIQEGQRDLWREGAQGAIDDPSAYLQSYEEAVADAEDKYDQLTFGVEGCLQ